MPDRAGDAGLHARRPARQGSARKPAAGQRGPHSDGPRAAAQADHRQPLPRRSSQGRQPLRPAGGALPPRRDGGDRRRAAGRFRGGGRTRARRAGDPLPRRAARRAACQRAWPGADLPRLAGVGGPLGKRGAGGRRAQPHQPAQPPARPAGAAPAPAGRGGSAHARPRPAPGQGAGNLPAARWRSRRRVRTTC